MFRISDLNKKDRQPTQPTPPAPPGSKQIIPEPAPPAKGSPEEPGAAPAKPAPPAPPASRPVPPSIMPPPGPKPPIAGAPVDLEQACGQLYEDLVAAVEGCFAQARSQQPLDLAKAWSLIEQLPTIKSEQCQALLALLERHSHENYLYSHAVNVAVLANHLGHCLGHPLEIVHELALAGLLLDIGMAGEAEEIVAQPRKLTADEWHLIAKHPNQALETLKTTRSIPPEMLEAIQLHHKRPDGSGYPSWGDKGMVSDYCKILAVCDVYDALTHPRSHRTRYAPAQAIKVLVDGAGTQFDRRVIKVLVDELSLYPRGSLIRLSTNEVARVDRVRPEAPLRPVVLVVRDANQQPLPTPRRVDLLEQPFVYIKDIVTEDES